MMHTPTFEIRESQQDGWFRLALVGELDMAAAPILEDRLTDLQSHRQSVLVDLSQLSFMDSTGLRIMVESIRSASADGWRFAIDPNLSSQVRTLFRITHLEPFVGTRRD
jgi:anti-anti-sigma factor